MPDISDTTLNELLALEAMTLDAPDAKNLVNLAASFGVTVGKPYTNAVAANFNFATPEVA